jgi:ABC-type branched-subunit amino acid transport system ATPase component
MFSVKNIIKKFGGVHALDSASLEFRPRQITGIVGPNGSGKTTLMNVISGVHSMDGGKIIISDRELTHIDTEKIRDYGITRTFQHSKLFDQMTVMENLEVVLIDRRFPQSLFGGSFIAARERAAQILQKLNIPEKADVQAGELSYGQRKLLEIGRVMAVDSDIVLLDEPFAGLFPEMVKQISGLLIEMKHAGKTVILIEHNMELMRSIPDVLYVMDAGRVIAHGNPVEVLSRPDVVEAYIGV